MVSFTALTAAARVVSAFLAECQDEGTAARLQAAFQELLSSNGLTKSLDRKNRMTFRRNLSSFLASARGFLISR